MSQKLGWRLIPFPPFLIPVAMEGRVRGTGYYDLACPGCGSFPMQQIPVIESGRAPVMHCSACGYGYGGALDWNDILKELEEGTVSGEVIT